MAEDKIIADGMFFKEKHQNAPEFVIGGLSIKVDQFAKFVKDHKDGEYLNFQVLKSKQGKPYIVLDTWKPNRDQAPADNHVYDDSKIDNSELPF